MVGRINVSIRNIILSHDPIWTKFAMEILLDPKNNPAQEYINFLLIQDGHFKWRHFFNLPNPDFINLAAAILNLRKMKNSCAGLFLGSSSISVPNLV